MYILDKYSPHSSQRWVSEGGGPIYTGDEWDKKRTVDFLGAHALEPTGFPSSLKELRAPYASLHRAHRRKSGSERRRRLTVNEHHPGGRYERSCRIGLGAERLRCRCRAAPCADNPVVVPEEAEASLRGLRVLPLKNTS
ncbi:hypothetical protein NDU88_001828 [Pleurodeles waltl]|uniref:Uncharacterized protein n=1 Tax=Pleurodeles waltl TaxID=8319 RepID=A0AAV7UVT3_PLEWA|nr:hypothetical protein NDU88_001828 [Pleurodeles waltl]